MRPRFISVSRDGLALQPPGGNGGIVEVAKARAAVGIGEVAARAAQGEGRGRTREDFLCAGNGRLRRGIGGAEGTLHRGAGNVAHVPAGAADDTGDARLAAAGKGGEGASGVVRMASFQSPFAGPSQPGKMPLDKDISGIGAVRVHNSGA